MVNGALKPGFDMGVNSSAGKTNWVTPDPAGGSQKMSCPAAQDWCAVFVVTGKVVNSGRQGTDVSGYNTLLVDLKGDSGRIIHIGIKDVNQPDDGTEQKVDVLLTTNWRTYAIPLTRFSRANLKSVYVMCEFVWDANSPWTASMRNIAFTTALAPIPDSVINAASFQSGLTAGAWNSVTGKNLSPSTRGWTNADFQGPKLPTALDGVSVQIGERDMAVSYVSPTQINTLVFGDVTPGSAYLSVTNPVGTSVPILVTVRALFPAIFTIDSANKYAAAVHLSGVVVGKAGLFGAAVTTLPAAPGETISIYGTGFGPTDPLVIQDVVLDKAFPLTSASSWRATIGGVSAPISFAGLTGSGLYQFNVTVPSVANGDQTVILTNGSNNTQSGVLITVQK